MANFKELKQRIVSKYQSLSTNKEKLEFMYQVQEKLRLYHNEKGKQFRDGDINESQWINFKAKWSDAEKIVAARVAELRDDVYKNDYNITDVQSDTPEVTKEMGDKRAELLKSTTYKADIDTIWQ